jgi:glycosyltransferase involved in cell wall biosynthesis
MRALIVSHEASRTGAPRVALDMVRALKEDGWDVRIALRWDGPLRSEFQKTGCNVRLEPLRRFRATLRRIPYLQWLANYVEQIGAAAELVRSRPQVVLCNTVLSACYVRPAQILGVKVILYAHEPGDRIAQVLGRYRLERRWTEVLLAGCAPTTCEALAEATGCSVDAVRWIAPTPDVARIDRMAAERPTAELPSAGVIVGAVGTADARKGVDLWLNIAARVASKAPDLDPHFVWVGGDPPPEFTTWAASTGMTHKVIFTGPTANPYPLMAAFDVFTLTSRVDPFPLVVLEAMALHLPVVSFAVGDVAVQLGSTGRIVPAESVDSAAIEVTSLLRDRSLRISLGREAACRVHDRFNRNEFSRSVARMTSDAVGTGRSCVNPDRLTDDRG